MLLTATAAYSQDNSTPPVRSAANTSPRLIFKVEPAYSEEARNAKVQGRVVLDLVVDERGLPTEVSVIGPLGFGLDEQAVAAVSKWRFAPAMKDGVPIRVAATVEVNFNLLLSETPDDAKFEQKRSAYNSALLTLRKGPAASPAVAEALQSLTSLSAGQFPPAMHLVALLKIRGEHLPQNRKEGLNLLKKAAARNYAPALYDLGLQRMEGSTDAGGGGLPRDNKKGLEEVHKAAKLGSHQAQRYLGTRYEAGAAGADRDGLLPQDLERAQHFYRLCASQGDATCQYRLGRMLLISSSPTDGGRRGRDYLQAVAFLELAAEQNYPEAVPLAANAAGKLIAEQKQSVDRLKRAIVRK